MKGVSGPRHFDCLTNDCIYVGETVTNGIQGTVESNLSSRGGFTVIKDWEEPLSSIISDSIRYMYIVMRLYVCHDMMFFFYS